MAQKTVIMVGALGAWTAPLPEGAELWSMNRAIDGHTRIDRLLLLHPPQDWLPAAGVASYIRDVNATGALVLTRDLDPRFERNARFPAAEIIRELGVAYFTSTVAWMIAQAIVEGFQRIVLHRLFTTPWHGDYAGQKPCLDFWCGVALGRGIKVELSHDSYLCRPHLWDTDLYAFEEATGVNVVDKAVALCIGRAMHYPAEFKPTAELPALRELPAGAIGIYDTGVPAEQPPPLDDRPNKPRAGVRIPGGAAV